MHSPRRRGSVKRQLDVALARADVRIRSSCFCRAELDAVGEPAQEGVELLALLLVEGGEEVLLGGRDRAFGAAQQLLPGAAQSQHVAPAVDLMAGALGEAAVAEVGGDRGEVAAVDAERVGEFGLARLRRAAWSCLRTRNCWAPRPSGRMARRTRAVASRPSPARSVDIGTCSGVVAAVGMTTRLGGTCGCLP